MTTNTEYAKNLIETVIEKNQDNHIVTKNLEVAISNIESGHPGSAQKRINTVLENINLDSEHEDKLEEAWACIEVGDKE